MNWKKNWKKITLWSLAGIFGLLIIAVATLVLLLENNAGFRQYILARVESSVEESTGARLEVRDFNLHLASLSLDLYGVIVHGKEPASSAPLLQTEHINVGVTILSVIHGKWRLRDVVIDHPVVHMYVTKAGENNLPQPKQKSTSQTNVFDMAIQKVVLSRGEVYYNDEKSPLDAELHDLSVNVNFDNAQSKYAGDLGYQQGRIQYGAYAPMVHNLQVHFDATQSQFNLNPLVFSTGDSKFELKASVEDYSNPKAQASYKAVLVGGDFRRLLKNPSVPEGTIELDGALNYQSDPNKPMLETVSVEGNVSSRELAVKTPSLRAQIRDVGAHYTLAGGNAQVHNIHAQLLGGRLDGNLVIHDLAGASQARLQAALKDVSIRELEAVSGNHQLGQAGVSGKVSATADARWAKTLDNLKAHSDVTIRAAIAGQKPPTPLNGEIHADYNGATQQVALNQSYIRTPKTSLNLDGKMSNTSQLQVRLQSNDLHELELLSKSFAKPTPGQPPQELGLYGTASFNGSVTGTTSNPQLNGQLVANNLRVKGSAWKMLRANVSASPSLASLTDGELQAATQGQINFTVETALNHWTYTPSSPVKIQVSAAQLSVADLERLAGQTYPVSGTLGVNVSLHGTQLSPVGQGSITLANAKVSTESIQNLTVNFHGTGDQVKADLNMKMPAGSAQANATYEPKTERYQAQLKIANLRVEKLQTVKARNLQVNGGLNLDASGSGTVQNPELTATLSVPELQVQKQTIREISFKVTVRDQVATLALSSAAAETYIRANGTVGIPSPYVANVRLDTGRIPFQPLVAIYAPAQAGDLNGQTELHATLRGPLTEKSRMEAHVEVPVLTVSYKQLQLAAKPIRLDYQNNVATLQPTAIEGTGTNIQMQGNVPVDNLKAASFVVNGTIDLQLAQIMVPDIQSSGQIRFDINSKAHSGSDVQGTVRIVNANFHSIDAPLGLSKANGVITLTRERVVITSFEGQTGGGIIAAKGGVTYHPSVQFDLALMANNVRLRYPDGLRAVLGSTLNLTGNTQAALLSGQVRIERVSFTQDFDLSDFMSQFTGESSPPPASGFAQSVKLNIAVQSTSQMNLTSSKVSLQGSANLRVVGTTADPVILGRTNLTGGEMFLASNRYILRSGTVDFLNPIRTEPVLNMQVETTIDQYNITLHLEGPMEHLRTNYSSDPALPPVDIINLIAFGKTTEASAANPSTPGNLGAQAVLSQGLGQVSSRVEKLGGISHLSIDPTLGGDQSNPGARIAIQQRVTSNLYVTFATDVTSTQRQEIQLEYKLNPRWSLSGVRDQNGGFGVDAKFHKKF